MKHDLLLVDAMPVIYAVFNKQGHFKTTTGIPTGVTYGFLRTMKSYQERAKAEKAVAVFDTHHPVLKAQTDWDIAQTYKANRPTTPEKQQMFDQIEGLKQALALTKWTYVQAPGYEADDILGTLARNKSAQGQRVAISTPDNDMLQLINNRVCLWRPKRGTEKDRYLEAEYVQDLYGVDPRQLLFLRAVIGDVSDNLKGAAPHLKAQTINWLNQTPIFDMDSLYDLFGLAMVLGQDTLEHNKALQQLRMNLDVMRLHDVPTEALEIVKGQRDVDSLTYLFEKLEFKSLMKSIPEYTAA